MKNKKELTAEELRIIELKDTIKETNKLYSDFGIVKRESYDDWKDKNVIQLENHRKSVIHNYLNKINEREGMA